MITALEFAVCAAVILLAGSRLSRFAELIAEKSGISKGWVGLVLLAMMTAMSQLVASLSAAVVHDLPDMAVSGLIGSCMFNLMVIGLLDLTSKDRPVSYRVHEGHILSVGFGIVLIGLAAIDMLIGRKLPVLTWAHAMDPITVAFVPIYLLAMRLTFRFERARLRQFEEEEAAVEAGSHSWLKLISTFLVCALCIVAASYYLPALAVSVSAACRGAFDMAVASLLGSNLCYMVIFAVTDFCYTREPLLRHVSVTDGLMALGAMISMGIVVIALTYRSEKKIAFIAGDAIALIFVYVLANVLAFMAH